jgi:hypothetical protein
MSTGEGQDPRGGPPPGDRDDRNERSRRGDSIGIGGGDDSVSRIQLAARWAEAYGREGDSLTSALKRFRTAYEYLDAVIHGVDPPELQDEVAAAPPPAYAPPPAPQWTSPATPASPESAQPSPWSRPTESGSTPPAPPSTEPRPWG